MRKVLVEELRRRTEEISRHLSDWLLAKSGDDIEKRYFAIGERRASQGIALSDVSWAIVVTEAHLWGIPAATGLQAGSVEIYGEMELLRLLDRFLDRALSLRRKAMSTTSSCSIDRGIEAPARDPDNPIRQAIPPASSEFVVVGAAI